MTLREEKEIIYSEIKKEIDEVKASLAGDSKKVEDAINNIKANDTGDARENAGLDIAKDDLIKLYQDITMRQQLLNKFQEIEEQELFNLLFPGVAVPDNCLLYNSIGKAVLYSTLRLKVHRGNGTIQDMIIILMPSGLNFKTSGCCPVDNPAVKLLMGSRAGDKIPFTCITGEKVVYEVLEIL